mgnify:FL=1|tara:strand:- start:115 stop:366 length:252 start_codon:yes stop_codon:yes gene_type:complete
METFKHRIFIKNSKIILILCREEYQVPNDMNIIAGNIDGGYDSYQDKDFTSDLHPPIWGLDGGNVIEMGDSHYETIRKSLEPS